MTEIVKYESIDELERLGKALVGSGYFEDASKISQAIVKVLAGREMGFGPIAAMTGIHIIKGRPAIGANLMAAAVKAHPRYDYRVKALSDAECVIAFFQEGQQIGESVFTAQDAQKAGTQNMGKFPRNMLFARAMSNGVKWFCPDVFLSGPVYTPDELGAVVDDDGGIIEMPVITVEASRVTDSEAERYAEETESSEPFFVAVEFGAMQTKDKGKTYIGFMQDGDKWATASWWGGRDGLLEAAPWIGQIATKEELGEIGRRFNCSMRVYYEDKGSYKNAVRFEQA